MRGASLAHRPIRLAPQVAMLPTGNQKRYGAIPREGRGGRGREGDYRLGECPPNPRDRRRPRSRTAGNNRTIANYPARCDVSLEYAQRRGQPRG